MNNKYAVSVGIGDLSEMYGRYVGLEYVVEAPLGSAAIDAVKLVLSERFLEREDLVFKAHLLDD